MISSTLYGTAWSLRSRRCSTTNIDWVHRILKAERDIVLSSTPRECPRSEIAGAPNLVEHRLQTRQRVRLPQVPGGLGWIRG
jgi:hypothetical protein